jgi:hypothetical protein
MFYLFIITCLLMLLTAIDLFYLKVLGRIGSFFLYYFLSGFLWLQLEQIKPRFNIPRVYWRANLTWAKIIVFVLWPLVLVHRVFEYFNHRKRDDRFMVLLEEEKSNRHDDLENPGITIDDFENPDMIVDDSADTEVTDDFFADFTDRKHHVFGNWSAALQFARSEAKRSGKDITILDDAKIIKRPFLGDYSEAAYYISPNGKVRKGFSFWQQIFCLY